MSKLVHIILVLATVLGVAAAQEQPEPFVYAVGTSTVVDGDHWAYLLWQPTKQDLLDGKHLAVYVKKGAPTSLGQFTRKSVTTLHTDPRTISGLLSRAERLGDDLTTLEDAAEALFESSEPAGDLTLAEKLSGIIRGSLADPVKRNTLFVLARQHPAMALALGQAMTCALPVPGVYTFEIREFDKSSNQDLGVIGRVTIDSNAPFLLPAPGSPVHVGGNSSEHHLVARLRWSTPDALREAALLHYGYDVYRLSRTLAEGLGLDTGQPDRTTFLTVVQDKEEAVRANRIPILIPAPLSDAEAGNPADETTVFFTEDNRLTGGGDPFEDGDRFYYYLGARDILGRVGEISAPGPLVTICDRIFPPSPEGVRVTTDYEYDPQTKTGRQFLTVHWKPVDDPESGTKQYYIYQWAHLPEMHANVTDPTAMRVRVVPHVPGQQQYSIEVPGSGSLPTGKHFFFTVRATDNGSCGSNVSPNSTPVPGTLRDRKGPLGGGGTVDVVQYRPQDPQWGGFTDLTQPGDNAMSPDEFICTTTDAEFLWAEFQIEGQPPVRTTFVEEAPGTYVARTRGLIGKVRVSCRVGTVGGYTSGTVFSTAASAAQPRLRANFTASVVKSLTTINDGESGRHEYADPPSADTNQVCVNLTPTAGSREFKIYRSVDRGVLTLVKRGEIPAGDLTPIQWKDDAVPSGRTILGYFAQLFDEHGNASPLRRLGGEIESVAPCFLPVPFLENPESLGTVFNPRMRLRWFCPPKGVVRFEVWISPNDGRPPDEVGNELSRNLIDPGTTVDSEIPGFENYPIGIYQTPHILSLPGAGGAEYSVDVTVNPSARQRIVIRVLGQGGYDARAVGKHSNLVDFKWHDHSGGGGGGNPDDVVWPARSLPTVADEDAFHPGIEAVFLPSSPHFQAGAWAGIGIRIGEYEYRETKYSNPVSPGNPTVYDIGAIGDPIQHIFRNSIVDAEAPATDPYAGRLMPFVLYRYQVSSAGRPRLNPDVHQVSPLMEQIAHDTQPLPTDPVTIVHDPFIAVLQRDALPDEPTHDIYMIDRQPVIRGASYRYLLVRFGRDKEIEQVIPTNTIDVPAN